MGGKPRVAGESEEAANRQLTLGILEAAPGGIVHVDRSGGMLSANQEALRILGMSFDKLSRQYVVDFQTDTIWEDGSACPPSAYPVSQALVTGESQPRATIGVRRPDGEVSWAVFTAVPVKDAQGATAGAVATFLDITERKKLEEARRISEATLSSVVESAPSFILTVDRSAKILFSNRDDLGQEPKSLVGENLYEAFAELGAADFREPVESVLDGGEAVGFQLQLQVARGIRHFAVRAGAVKSGEQVEGVTLVASDVTEFTELQSQLIVSERLAALGTLAAGVAHEINNPLTYLLLKLSALAKTAETENESEQHIGDLRAAIDGAERIARIVRDLGTVSRLESRTSESVNLAKLLDVAIDMVRVETRARATVRKSCGALSVKGDEARLVQVFLNLLINAAQAIDEGNVSDNEISVVASETEDSRICIQVKDTGRGIPSQDVERVFEPFYTTKGHREGTGLGLHVCHQIITSLGGELTVQSELGQGSCFSVYLPTAEVSTPAEKEEGHGSAEAAQTRHNILVVDDEGLIRETLQMLLRGHDVTLAANGREAIECLQADDFDVVFCDLIMPDLTGVDVFEYLHTEGKGRQEKIVFMTGGTFKTRTREFLKSVPNRVLLKPFPLEEIHNSLPS